MTLAKWMVAVLAAGLASSEAIACDHWTGGPDIFDGCKRRAAKTAFVSLTDAPAQKFVSVVQLRKSLDADAAMRNLGISSGETSQRVDQENRNVYVYAVIYKVTREDDNDYHVIVGDPGCSSASCFMNVEVSGLPQAASQQSAFRSVREKLVTILGFDPGSGYADVPDRPRVRIDGSLFYDIDHTPGTSGPAGFKPSTSWEIHPVRRLKKLQQ